MTNEEAIKELQEDIDLYMPETWVESVDRDTPDGRLITALEMAIEALKQEPCEDAISRSAVYECIDCTNTKAEAINAIKGLPFIIPKEPIGHWLRKPKVVDAYDIAGIKTWGVEYLCSLCEFTTTFIQDHGHYHYCPNCGAKMVEPQESEG